MRSSTAISRGSMTCHSPPAQRTAPQRWQLVLTTSRRVLAKTLTPGNCRRAAPIIPLKPSIWPARSRPPAGGPWMPRQSWKSSSLPTRMSDAAAISVKARRSSASRPFQKEARWFRSKLMRLPAALARRASSRQHWLVSGDRAAKSPERCTICTPSDTRMRSRSKSAAVIVRPTSPARSFCTRGPRAPNPLSARLNWWR